MPVGENLLVSAVSAAYYVLNYVWDVKWQRAKMLSESQVLYRMSNSFSSSVLFTICLYTIYVGIFVPSAKSFVCLRESMHTDTQQYRSNDIVRESNHYGINTIANIQCALRFQTPLSFYTNGRYTFTDVRIQHDTRAELQNVYEMKYEETPVLKETNLILIDASNTSMILHTYTSADVILEIASLQHKTISEFIDSSKGAPFNAEDAETIVAVFTEPGLFVYLSATMFALWLLLFGVARVHVLFDASEQRVSVYKYNVLYTLALRGSSVMIPIEKIESVCLKKSGLLPRDEAYTIVFKTQNIGEVDIAPTYAFLTFFLLADHVADLGHILEDFNMRAMRIRLARSASSPFQDLDDASGAVYDGNTLSENGNGEAIVKSCIACYESRVMIVIIPCGHACCCADCIIRLRECPLCRQQIQSVQRLKAAKKS
eukprot:TRINITY_DN11004_c0_g1_i1.p1 TRINITY_DN11004_c0_g1~~TRINITY_DN11004_c0_g1_i1.p1  ORF type:complete len:429 (+),score=98.47 TRINITY_DN11004_c0_g1_i1:39-1325(+)